ncbi:MAG: hypothetical protein Q8T08_21880 [Ignavibacteria bacterium]|nr:hypothetical protein [Ignavibacteria bacterium]
MTDLEQKYFRLSVLGILADRTKIGVLYKTAVPANQSILDFFIHKEKCTMLDIERWTQKHNSEILRIRSLANKERIEGFVFRETFLQWYLDEEKKCCYCGIKENDLSKYFHSENEQYKDARQRGQYLEIERVVTAPKSKNIYTLDNTKLACYVCNNAKSDFLSTKDFEPIALGIHNFWKKQDSIKEIVFPIEFYKTIN